jgi:nucleoside-triphosphatase THEP1
VELNGLIDKFEVIEIKNLVKADWNYKEEDESFQQILTNSTKKYAQLENLIVRELETGAYEIVNGNHRYESYLACGLKKVMVRNLGKISLAEAKSIAIATNEGRFKSNDAKLYALLKEISEDIPVNEMSKMMPYSEELINDKIGSLDFNFDQFNKIDESVIENNVVENSKKSHDEIRQNSTLYVKLDEQMLENWNDLIKSIKKCLFPENNVEEIHDMLAYQAIFQFLTENDYKKKISANT